MGEVTDVTYDLIGEVRVAPDQVAKLSIAAIKS